MPDYYALIPVPLGLTFEQELQAALQALRRRQAHFAVHPAELPTVLYGLIITFPNPYVNFQAFFVILEIIVLGMYENGGDTSDYRFRVSHCVPRFIMVLIEYQLSVNHILQLEVGSDVHSIL